LRDRLAVLQTDGAVNLVSFNGVPARIPTQQIEAIKQVLEKRESVDRADYPVLGTRVKVARGPLSGLEGILRAIKNSHKLVISIDTIKQAIAVEIDPCDVVSIQPS
jgi:transcription antitermination factor NusG